MAAKSFSFQKRESCFLASKCFGHFPSCSFYYAKMNGVNRNHGDILPQSFDPEADPELKEPPDPSGISIRRILGNFTFRSGQKFL